MVTVENLLQLPVFGGSTLVAGRKGLTHAVRYVDIAEVPDVRFWINPDVFILTTAYAFHKDAQELMAFMESLVRNGAAGLGIKLGRFLDELPREFCGYADRFDLPVVLLPSELRYTYAIRAVTEAILEDERAGSHVARLDGCFVRLLFGESTVEGLEGFEEAGFAQSARASIVVVSGAPSETTVALAALRGLVEGEARSGLSAIARTSAETILLTRGFLSMKYDLSRCVHFFPEGVYAAVGGEYALRDIRRSYDEAVRVLRFLKLFRSPKGIYSTVETELFAPLLCDEHREKSLEAARRLLGPLVEHDAANGSDLLETLWIFALCDRDHKETSQRLHLHRNTLRYRLSKIEHLLPDGSLKGAAFHRLFLALMIYFSECASSTIA